MTQNEIILMADASGLSWYGMGKDREKFLHYLEAFAALVAAAKQEPVAFYHPQKGFYWAKPTKVTAPTVVDVEPLPLYAAAQPPPEWELINNIIAEYGLQAIDFVADWKAAQRPWQGLTEKDWEYVKDSKGTSLDTFDHGAAWAADQLMERNT